MRNLLLNKKGQGGGLVTSLVMGIAGLVIGIIIAFLVVATLINANILTSNSAEANATSRLSANFTSGVNNVATQIPTILLIAAIVLILGVLAVLVAVWQRMRLGGGGSL